MKKKVVFMIINMNIGGTEKALLNMIAEMPRDHYDISILMLEETGGFLDYIPSHVHVQYLEGYSSIKPLLNQPPIHSSIALLKNGKTLRALKLLARYLFSKLLRNKSILFKYLLKNFPKLNKKYDIAIAYAGPMDFISYFVLNKITATKKVQWIHFDVTRIGFDPSYAKKLYSKFHKIFVASQEGKEKLVERVPGIANKVEAFPNLLSEKVILKMAEEGSGFQDDYEGVRILTVGRLSYEKGQDLIIKVLAKMKEQGIKVRWYCIGEGNERKNYEELIKRYGLKEDFILLGAVANPYPFMKQCDLYVQPSRHEGYCITLAEAKFFGKPIVSTNFTGAKEQILNNNTGIIVDFNELQLYSALEGILSDKTLSSSFVNNLIIENTKTL
ncbi:glycosyltransferase [Halobacillus amylolyticus]|uniref:Glycosyltransferase n=1 Tax=Halobacillus amylolyticus TaxID=2932259 RepID=A0ABY4HIP7_9BACI|nr:glycosyltransferase [Halobacillus amylolyticus]UOR13785.1 glycosyltransferase [Halobacillus amylolyticus]